MSTAGRNSNGMKMGEMEGLFGGPVCAAAVVSAAVVSVTVVSESPGFFGSLLHPARVPITIVHANNAAIVLLFISFPPFLFQDRKYLTTI